MREQISIVIPTRNEASTIHTFLASIPPEFELVVVDASDDATTDIIRTVRPHNTQIIHSQVHISQARQIGAEAAHGEWVLFSDADVRFATDYFALLTTRLRGDAIYGAKLATRAHATYSHWFRIGQELCQRVGLPAASGSNMLVRRALLSHVGGFRMDLPVNEDSELFLRLAHLGYQVIYRPELETYSTDDRRLARGPIRKMLHSVLRCAVIFIGMHVPLPLALLRHDWGYWRTSQTT